MVHKIPKTRERHSYGYLITEEGPRQEIALKAVFGRHDSLRACTDSMDLGSNPSGITSRN